MRDVQRSFKEMAMKQARYASFEEFERTELRSMRSFYEDMDDVLDTDLFRNCQDHDYKEPDVRLEYRAEW